jgi:hypothetical protein
MQISTSNKIDNGIIESIHRILKISVEKMNYKSIILELKTDF